MHSNAQGNDPNVATGRFIVISALVAVSLIALTSQASAGGSTISVGARTRGYQPALVGEFWIGRLGFSAEAGLGLSESDLTIRSQDGSSRVETNGASSLQFGGAMYYVLARGKRSQLSAGLRFGYGRSHVSFDEGRDGTQITTTKELTAPVRFEVWIVERMSLYAELGMGIRDSKRENKGENQFGGVEDEGRQLFTFGDPLGNAGISFHF